MVIAILAATFGAEFLLYYFAPRWLSRIAVLPLPVTARVELGPKALETLVIPAPHSGGYRDRATQKLDLVRAAGDLPLQGPDYLAFADLANSVVVVRVNRRWGGALGRRVMGIVRLDLVPGGDSIAVRARCHPLPLLSWIALSVTGFLSISTAMGILIWLVFLLAMIGFTVAFLRAPVRDAIEELATRLDGVARFG